MIHAGAFLFANSDRTDMTTVSGSGVVSVTTEIEDGTLNFGVELKNYQSNDCKFDHFSLECLGAAEDVTEVETLAPDNHNSTYYDIFGRKLSGKPSQKGIYIMNGKKYLF